MPQGRREVIFRALACAQHAIESRQTPRETRGAKVLPLSSGHQAATFAARPAGAPSPPAGRIFSRRWIEMRCGVAADQMGHQPSILACQCPRRPPEAR